LTGLFSFYNQSFLDGTKYHSLKSGTAHREAHTSLGLKGLDSLASQPPSGAGGMKQGAGCNVMVGSGIRRP
jgi:hypothetical protein